MGLKEMLKKIWEYLKRDTWDSWVVSLILVFIAIKFILFPLLSLATGSSLPLVVVESCSMYHEANFDEWWDVNYGWYESHNITKEEFQNFKFANGLNKGDIILVLGKNEYEIGDTIIYKAPTKYPLIHRVISEAPIATKGDNNKGQLAFESDVDKGLIIGRATARLPYVGWAKLIFFEPFKDEKERGLCR